MMSSMMRPPPPPARRSDPSFRPPLHPSFPGPQRPTSGMYTPSRPSSSVNYFPPGPSQSQYLPPIISPIPRPDSRAPTHPFQALVSTQPMPETAEKEEEREYESYQSSMPEAHEAQPMQHHTSFSQLYTQPSSQSQAQSNHILVQETHVPRQPPRAQASVDLLGGFSPPTSSIPLPPPRQRTQSETVIPETRPESQSQSQDEGSQTGPPKRVDTYRPEPPRAVEARRPVNVWQMGVEGGGQGIPSRRAATSMGRPASSMGAVRQEGRGMAGMGGKGAAELFMASTQQQGGSKTASEKIMDALSDWSTQILDVVAELKADQKKVRDQVHEVQTGQRTLATREEVVEEITAQLSPALHEFFKTLHAKIDSSVKPLPEETAKLASEEMRRIVMEIEQFKASQRSQDDSQEKPIIKLLDHLISKLDAVSHISDFLHGCKDLPEALRDVVIYKQSMDALTAITKNAPPPAPSLPAAPLPPAQIDTAVLRGIQQAMEDLANQFHQHASSTVAAGEDTRVMNAIHSLAKGLDSLPIHHPPPPPPTLPQAETFQLVEPPKLSHDMLQLRGKVDALSTDMRDIKAILARQQAHPLPPPPPPPPPQQPALDVADIVAQLKAALLPSLIAELQPTPVLHIPAQTPIVHPPQLLPPLPFESEYAQPGPEDYSQLQPTEVGNSQSQTAQFYPTPISNLRDRSSTTIQALTQPSSEISRLASEAECTQTSCDIGPPATAPPAPPPTYPTPSSSSSIKIASFSTQPTLKLRPDGTFGRVPPPPSDVFGQIQPITAPAPAAALPTPAVTPALGTGNLGVSEEKEDDLESLDEYEDVFNAARQKAPSKPSLPPKGRGKRSASNSGSASSSSKRARTRTSGASTTPLPSIPSSPRPKSHKKKPAASDPIRISSDSSPETPVLMTGIGSTLLDPSSMPGGGVLKRSPRLVAVRTASSDPMYNSDLPSGRKSKAIKQELIDAIDMTSGPVTGLGSATQPISFEDSSADSLDKYIKGRTRSQAVKEDTDSFSSQTSKRTSPRLAKASNSEMAGAPGPSKGQAGGKGRDDEAEESLFLTPKDPAPMARTATYGRRNRAANISYGGDDSDADDTL